MGEGPGVPGVSEAERPPGGVGSSGARAEASQPPRAQAPRQSCFLGPTCPRQQEDVAVLPRTQGTLRGQRWGRRHHTPGGRPLLGSRADCSDRQSPGGAAPARAPHPAQEVALKEGRLLAKPHLPGGRPKEKPVQPRASRQPKGVQGQRDPDFALTADCLSCPSAQAKKGGDSWAWGWEVGFQVRQPRSCTGCPLAVKGTPRAGHAGRGPRRLGVMTGTRLDFQLVSC